MPKVKQSARERAEAFTQKHKLEAADILYLLRRGGKTAVRLLDGSEIRTDVSQKSLRECLCRSAGKDAFCCVTKGVTLSALQIASIERNVYTMTDGTAFVGRQRNFNEHKRMRSRLARRAKNDLERSSCEYRILAEKFDCLEKMPLPFCVLELVWNGEETAERGALDLLFRYANPAMSSLLAEEPASGTSYLAAFEQGDLTRLARYVATARGGAEQTFPIPMPDGSLKEAHCFSPADGYCALLLLG